jgi:hypothetical protein
MDLSDFCESDGGIDQLGQWNNKTFTLKELQKENKAFLLTYFQFSILTQSARNRKRGI